MKRIMLSLVFALLAVPAFLQAADAPKPNIVLFLADDLGWADVTWHGSAYRMPCLDKLAKEGVLLEAHYVHPMCSPTRTALMSGRYASRFGVTAAQNERAMPWNTVTLARALKSAGYETALTGKWHLGSKPEEGPQKFGFDHSYGLLAGGCGPFNHRYKEGEFTHTWHRDGKLIEEEGHVTDLIAREAVRWIEERTDKPFFLYVPFSAIHVPIQEPEKWTAMNAGITDPAERLRSATTSHMDGAITEVLAALDRKKLRDNTIVIFLSDNGAHPPTANQGGAYPGNYGDLKVGHDNTPFRGYKTEVYEGGIRTPGIVHWPAKLKPGKLETPMFVVDWMPTFCALAGANPPGDLKWDGVNLWPLLSGQVKGLPARTLYSASPSFRAQMVRHGDWKLVVTKTESKKKKKGGAGVGEELFNLIQDPSETKNLAADKPEILAEMKQRLKDISARDKDALPND